MRHKIRLDGLTSLLQSNGAQVLLPRMPKQRAVKQQENFDAPGQAELGLYKMRGGEFGHPAAAFRGAFITAAKQYKVGRQSASKMLAGALSIEPADLVVLTDKRGKPLSNYEVDVRVIVNHNAGGARLPAAKPRFDDWHCFLTLELDEAVWPDTKEMDNLLFEIIGYAGRAIGVGSGRPELRKLSFGKFKATKIK